MKIIRKVLGGFCILEACGGVIAAIAVPEPGLLSITVVFGLLAWLCFRKPKSKGLPNQEQQIRSAQAEGFVEPVFNSSFAPQEVPEDVLRDMRKYYSPMQAQNDARILAESFKLCQQTYDFETFFSRLQLARRCAYTLLQANQAGCKIDKRTIKACESALSAVDALVLDFLDRVFEKETSAAMQLKTPAGRHRRLETLLNRLQEHDTDFTLIENAYNEYLEKVRQLIEE